MSFDPFAHSSDLNKLAADGYELELTQGGHLLVKEVPYRTSDGRVDRGVLVTKVEFNGDVTVNPVADHVCRFIGSAPCNGQNQPLRFVTGSSDAALEPGLTVNHQMSAKPDTPFVDYHSKITSYVGLISSEAQALDESVTAKTGGPSVVDSDDWPFEYVDTASGRAGIGALTAKLCPQKIAIVGVGGTGSYILDLVAKCPVDEIHLLDDDRFSTHNAFRAPGAPTLDELRAGTTKVDHLASVYTRMKRKVFAHPVRIDATNADLLRDMSFVFLAMEGGPIKKDIVEKLEQMQLAFIDCSIGVEKSDTADALLATLQITASTPEHRAAIHETVDFGAVDEDDEYSENIQIAELNALNATLAVLWWKKHSGVYYGTRGYHHQRLNVAFNRLMTE